MEIRDPQSIPASLASPTVVLEDPWSCTVVPEMFEEEVRRLVREWQERLRLMDWELVLEFPEEDPGCFAVTDCVPAYQGARIRFRKPSQHPEGLNTPASLDTEVTVVHELLHVRTGNIPGKAHKVLCGDPQWEAAIEITARALVAAKRGQMRM